MTKLVVISGSDEAAVKSRALALVAEWFGPDYDQSNDLETIRGDDDAVSPEASLKDFAAAAATPPFFGGEKTVWLRHWNGFKLLADSRAAKSAEALAARFADELVTPAAVPGVRMLVDGPGLDGRKTLAKTLKAAADVELEMLNLPDTRARDFARQQAASLSAQVKNAGFKITPDAAEYLAAATGGDTARRANELEKLYCYVAPEKTITLEACHEVVSFDVAAVSWKLGSALSERNAAAALSLVTPLLRQLKREKTSGNQELSLLWSAAGAFTDIVQTRSYMSELEVPARFGPNFFDGLAPALKEKFPKNKLLSYHPYRAYKLCESASRWPSGSCAKAFDLIVEAQRKMVSGGDSQLVLEKLILDLCAC